MGILMHKNICTAAKKSYVAVFMKSLELELHLKEAIFANQRVPELGK